MDRKSLAATSLLCCCAFLAFPAYSKAPDATLKATAAAQYGNLPLAFEVNQGQADPSMQFLARGAGYGIGLGTRGAVLSLPVAAPSDTHGRRQALGAVLHEHLVGGNSAGVLSGEAALPGSSNYLGGNDARQWHTGIAQYARVRQAGVYPGVDLVYYGNQNRLEYDFNVAPGADPRTIVLQFDGARKLRVDADGNLLITTAAGDVVQQHPLVYQDDADGQRTPVAAAYRLLGRDRVAFQVAAYDTGRTLVIDPILALNLYVPGVNTEVEKAVAVDSAGSAYIAGYSTPMNWLRNLPLVGTLIHYDAFVAKLNPAGNALVYLTYFGGSSDDEANAIAVDAAGSAYVTGYTNSNDFPTLNPAQRSKQGYDDAFVVKLRPDGKGMVYSTFLGGTSNDVGESIAVDAAGDAYIGGYTASLFFPTTSGALQTSYAGGSYDGFVTKLSPAGNTLIYATLIGGGNSDSVNAIAIDGSGNAYIGGSTASADFPVRNAFQPALSPPFVQPTYSDQFSDAFVAKINPSGSALVYSTYLGGTFDDSVNAIAVDALGNAYVAGNTYNYYSYSTANNFPQQAPLQTTAGPGFVTELSSAGNALVFSTYLDGVATGVALDVAGDIHVAGYTSSTTFHTRLPYQPANSGSNDAYLIKIGPHGSGGLVYGTYLGSSGNDTASAVALDSQGNAYIAGNTSSKNFPATKPVQGASFGHGDGFVSKFSSNGQTLMYSTYLGETNVFAGLVTAGGKGIGISIPIRGIVGCTLRALPDGVVFPIEILYPSHAPCGQPQPAP